MADEPVIIVDDAGHEHEFPAGMDPKRAGAIVREKTYQPGKLATHAMSGDAGGYPEGVDPSQSPNSQIAAALEPLAHPQSATDFAGLAIPGGMGGALAPYLKPIQAGASKYGGAVAELATSFLPRKAQGALKVLGELTPSNWHNPLTVAGREGRATAASRAFNDLPLAEQMNHLPETPAPVTSRGAEPPHQAPPPTAAPTLEDELRKAGVGEHSIGLMRQRQQGGITPMASHPQAAPMPSLEPIANAADTPIPTRNPDKPFFTAPEVADNLRRMHGSEQGSRMLYGSGGQALPRPEAQAAITRLAPGPSRLPYAAEGRFLDQRFKQLIDDPKAAWLLPLLAPQVRQMLLSGLSDHSD